MSIKDPISVQDTQELLASGRYVANESLATALFLSLSLKTAFVEIMHFRSLILLIQ